MTKAYLKEFSGAAWHSSILCASPPTVPGLNLSAPANYLKCFFECIREKSVAHFKWTALELKEFMAIKVGTLLTYYREDPTKAAHLKAS